MATLDPRRIISKKDAWISALYAKTVGETDDDDCLPLVIDSNGYLLVNLTVGSITLSTTLTTIDNTPTVTLSNTQVTVGNTVTVTGTVTTSANTTLTTIDNTPTVTLSATDVTINNGALNPVNVSLDSTKVTVDNSLSLSDTRVTVDNTVAITLNTTLTTIDNTPTVTLSSTEVTIGNNVTLNQTAVSVTNTVNTTLAISKTVTSVTGSVASTNTTIIAAGTLRKRVYAYALTTTSATEVICVFHSDGTELWRISLLAPSGASAGANLSIMPPAYLFASRTASAVSLSVSTTDTVHYSVSHFEE